MASPLHLPAMPGILYIVSTPIGNLGDITVRALDVLRAVALILAEDTRHARILLDRYEIRTPVAAYHEHNEARASGRYVERLQGGDDLALISDAGTPLLSDPGARLVRATLDAGVQVVPIPGPSAMLAALVASGLSDELFTFVGFLPRRGRERNQRVAQIVELPHVVVMYESPHRTATTLQELSVAGASARQAAVARELTKQYEEVRRGTVQDLAAYYASAPPRGEVTIVLGPTAATEPNEQEWRTQAAALRDAGHSAREIVDFLVDQGRLPRNRAYRLAHDLDRREIGEGKRLRPKKD